MKKILFLIVPDGFRDEEYAIPKKIFEANGYTVTTVSTVLGSLTGKRGLVTATVDRLLSEVSADDYAAVVIVGGQSTFWNNQNIINLLKEMHAQNKVIGAICSSAVLPAQAGLLTGLKATAFPGEPERKELKKYKVINTEAPVEVAGNIVTGRDVDASEQFARAILGLLV
jgi:protease I